jgi:hypothetical protein
MGDDRPIRYLDPDGTVVYRASGLGVCDGIILGLARGRRPNRIPDWLLEVFEEGSRMEQPILDHVIDSHPDLVLDQQTEWTLEIGEINDRLVIVRGHSDGFDITAEQIVEAKKFRPSTWPKFLQQKVECSPLYPWQTSVYMHAARQLGIEAALMFVGGEYIPELIENGVVVQEEHIKSVRIFQYPDPPIPFNAIRKRIVRWENLIEDGLDVTDLTEPCTPRQFPCAMFGKGCPSEALKDEVVTVKVPDRHREVVSKIIDELESQGRIITTFQRGIDAAKEKKKNLEAGLAGIVEDMESAGEITGKARLQLDDVVLNRVAYTVEEKQVTRAAFDVDYWKLTREEPTP